VRPVTSVGSREPWERRIIIASPDVLQQLRQIEQSVSLVSVGGPNVDVVPSGAFRAFLSPHSKDPELNYAMPVETPTVGSTSTAELEALRQVFAARERRLRVEFVEELWPNLTKAVSLAGLGLVNREPLMACTPETFQPISAPGVNIHLLTADDEEDALRAYLIIRDELPQASVEMVSEASKAAERAEVELLRDAIRRVAARGSGWFALARWDGTPAGTGRCERSGGGLGELTAIVTRADLRRRGIAATTTSVLVSEYFRAGGALAWLTAANSQAASVYQRIGFRSLGYLVNYEDAPA
jgi:ribosomal protein S18 acetylase RimI-like enzyme